MKRSVCIIAVILMATATGFSQADRVLGYWLTEEGDSQVRIFRATNGKYYGQIEWLKEPFENGKPKVDDDNPDPALQNRPILGLRLLNGFEYDGDDTEWQNGTIYDPKTGNTYDCYMWFGENNGDVLCIKGYIMGIRFLGRETKWTREGKLRD